MRMRKQGRWVIGCVVWLAAGATARSQDEITPLKDTRALLDRWVETERLIAKENAEWDLARQMLEARITILEREIQGLEGGADAAAGTQEVNAAGARLVAEHARLAEVTRLLDGRLAALERRVGAEVLPLLPDVLKERIAPAMRRSPDGTNGSGASLVERWRNLTTILGEVAKFNGEATVVNESRTMPDGKTIEVRTLYLGIGHAFYANVAKGIAGRGVPAEDGWRWEEIPGAAHRIARAIDNAAGEKATAPVALPIVIR